MTTEIRAWYQEFPTIHTQKAGINFTESYDNPESGLSAGGIESVVVEYDPMHPDLTSLDVGRQTIRGNPKLAQDVIKAIKPFAEKKHLSSDDRLVLENIIADLQDDLKLNHSVPMKPTGKLER